MSRRRIAALALSGALLAGGAGAAIAAVTKDERDKSEQAILDDAAGRLDVTPQKLREALAAAQDAQLDKAVKAGDLTQKQADAIRERRKQSGHVLGMPHGLFGKERGFHGAPGFGPHRGARGAVILDLAKALGITRQKLREGLRDGKSVADLAKAQGKTLADVRAAVKADAKQRADKAVKDGDLTQAQADKLLSHLDEMVEHLGEAPRVERRFHDEGPPDLRPGSFAPAPPDELEPDLLLGIAS